MKSKVYFLDYQSKKNDHLKYLPELLEKINPREIIKENDFTAIKLTFGEKGNFGHLKPAEVKPVVEKIKTLGAHPFVTDANTIYVGERSDAVHHLQTASFHGFREETLGCPILIADGLRGNSYVEVEINPVRKVSNFSNGVNLKHFKKVKIAHAIHYTDSIVFLTHFKGHEVTGFGGTLKNMGMGCGARAGKYEMHHSIVPEIVAENCTACGLCIKWCPSSALTLHVTLNTLHKESKIFLDKNKCTGCGECILTCHYGAIKLPWNESVKNCQEKIVEYAYGAVKNKNFFCINFLQYITKYCDCYGRKEEPLIPDIGILVSTDPVAIDQASVDLVNKKFGKDFFRDIFPQIDWTIQLDYAEKIGLGSRKYELISV
ncbi:MAG TPA: 4Fe-4S ferredoxin [Elusimicrobia bacterium]|jgi:hypothetical protein|nr:4Fe-4S ferredoxin [Elusimicrobiota bacterium]